MAGKKSKDHSDNAAQSSSTGTDARSRSDKTEQQPGGQENLRTAQDKDTPAPMQGDTRPRTPPPDDAPKQPAAQDPAQALSGETEDAETVEKPFPIVGLGASAGGLEALEAFFEQVPADCGMAFVVITHTDPDHASMLPELIRRRARIAVREIEDGMPTESGTVYIPPTDRDPHLERETFRLRKRPGRTQTHMPVDLFFKSLAAARSERAACVVLSGTGTDGTQGLRLIKERSGLAMVQSRDSAHYGGMPESALGTGLVDYVLTPKEMPERLMEYFKHPVAIKPPPLDEEGRPDPLRRIINFLAARTRHDFSLYKKSTLVRRIERRMTVTRSHGPEDYLLYLHRNAEETRALFQDLLIGVTSFFRDPEAFAQLKLTVVRKLIESTQEGDPLRVWIAGCATGEEAYSVAILFKEIIDERNTMRQLQLFGTDIDTRAIERARQGVYLQNIAADVSAERLKRFFVRDGDQYRVKSEIRESVVFAEQNILRDPPFSGLDLLVCRNLLIYLRAEAQEKLLPLFHYTLKKGGCLFLGTSESIGRFPELFAPLSKQHSLYQKKETLLRPQVQFPTGAREFKGGEERTEHETPRQLEHSSLSQAVERTLLKEHTPAAVIVNGAGEILHIHGRTGKYLEPAPGKPNLRLADMAREGLRFALLAALRRAAEGNQPVREHCVRVKTNGAYQRIALTVQRFAQSSLKDAQLVIFEDLPDAPADAELAERSLGEAAQEKIEALEHELLRVRQDYQSAVEELETSNEEMRSVNEEMHSSNEELQSTNEELESSREELQSLNEELNTVNSELHSKIGELNEAYSAITQVLNATRIAIVFLDTDLCVRRFTEEAARLINLIGSDVGRPFKHIATNLACDNLAEKTEQVLKRLAPFEDEVQTKDGRWYRMSVLLHRTQEHVIEGVVLTFVDIEMQKTAERVVAESGVHAAAAIPSFAEALIETVHEAVLVLDAQMRVVTANRRFFDTFGEDAVTAAGRSLFELCGGRWDLAELRGFLEQVARDGRPRDNLRIELRLAGTGLKRLRCSARRLPEQVHDKGRLVLIIEELTDRPEDESGSSHDL